MVTEGMIYRLTEIRKGNLLIRYASLWTKRMDPTRCRVRVGVEGGEGCCEQRGSGRELRVELVFLDKLLIKEASWMMN
jgi:hypothetical protein